MQIIQQTIPEIAKTCTCCGIFKAWSDFDYDRTRSKDGKRNDCKDCRVLKGHFVQTKGASRDYAQKCLQRDKERYGGYAWGYTITFSYSLLPGWNDSGIDKIYVGCTSIGPTRRLQQHYLNSHNSDVKNEWEAIQDIDAEYDVRLHLTKSRYSGGDTPELIELETNRLPKVTPHIAIYPFETLAAARMWEQIEYDKLSKLKVELLNKVRPSG